MRRLSIMLLVLASMSVEIMHAAPQGYRWRAETTDLRPFNIDAFRGETLTLTPTLLAYGVPLDLSGVDSATFYWQTNGSAVASWWSTPATVSSATGGQVRAVWSNACDVGASSYNWFIGLSSSSGASYRVYGRLALRHSPGWSPSAAPPPPALWVSPADLLAVSNALAVALQSLPPPGASEAALAASNAAERAWAAAYTDSATSSVPAQIAAGSVLQAARADYAVTTDILISQSGASGLIVRDGTSCTYTVATYSLAPAVLVISSAGGSQYDGPPIGTEFRYCATSNWGQTAYTNGVGDQVFDSGGINNCWAMQTAAGTWRNDVYMETPLPVTIGKEMHPNPLNYAVLDWKTVTATNWVCLPGNHNTDSLAHGGFFVATNDTRYLAALTNAAAFDPAGAAAAITLAGLGGVPITRTISINGSVGDLSTNLVFSAAGAGQYVALTNGAATNLTLVGSVVMTNGTVTANGQTRVNGTTAGDYTQVDASGTGIRLNRANGGPCSVNAANGTLQLQAKGSKGLTIAENTGWLSVNVTGAEQALHVAGSSIIGTNLFLDPVISTRRAFLRTDGTNLFFTNVNQTTNQLTNN